MLKALCERWRWIIGQSVSECQTILSFATARDDGCGCAHNCNCDETCMQIIMPRPLGGGIKRWCASDVFLSVAYIGPKSRTERPGETKIGTEVAHVTRGSDTTKVKRSKVNLQGLGAYCGGLPHSLFASSSSQITTCILTLRLDALPATWPMLSNNWRPTSNWQHISAKADDSHGILTALFCSGIFLNAYIHIVVLIISEI